MRITPLICWSCSNWFLPKTKRKNKFCSNACRQAHYLKKQDCGYPENNCLVQLYWCDEDDCDKLNDDLKEYCSHEVNPCVECMFEQNYNAYCNMVFERGRDKFNMSAREWLVERAKHYNRVHRL